MRLLGDIFQAFRTVVDGIHGRHVCQQSLRCANVRRRFVPTNVLFSRLHCHSQARIPVCIDGNTDNSPRHQTLVLFRGRQEARVWTAVAHRHAKSLSGADNHVCTPFSRWLQLCQCQDIARCNNLHAPFVRFFNNVGVIQNRAICRRVLYHHTTYLLVVVIKSRFIANDNFQTQTICSGSANFDRLRVTLVRNVKLRLFTSRDGGAHSHCLCRRCPFVQQRRVRQWHLCQIGNHGLKVQ
mmetsp:Transcript_8290/g.24400  ORF Transcript_8290/g.24400 Transcript_8290/m.24400 type:complete len:239 (+) Transcript_8290:1971-2687(+)